MAYRLSARMLLGLMLLVAALACQPEKKSIDSKPKLPEKAPPPPAIEFTGTAEEWPPSPRGRENVTFVPTTTRVDVLTAERAAALRTAVLQEARVRTALGERFGFVAAAQLDPAKDRPGQPGALAARLTFYSYSNNVAVEVLTSDRRVDAVNRREGYQPPEGTEEIEAAIALARRDARLRNVVEGMSATAIVTYRPQNQPGYGHRVLHVSFSAPNAEAPRYYALVDLTDLSILTAGPVPGAEGGAQ